LSCLPRCGQRNRSNLPKLSLRQREAHLQLSYCIDDLLAFEEDSINLYRHGGPTRMIDSDRITCLASVGLIRQATGSIAFQAMFNESDIPPSRDKEAHQGKQPLHKSAYLIVRDSIPNTRDDLAGNSEWRRKLDTAINFAIVRRINTASRAAKSSSAIRPASVLFKRQH